MQLDIATATVLAAGVGAIVAGGISALNGWLIRRSDERRQIRDLAVRAATEEWKVHIDLSIKQHKQKILPFSVYLIHAMYFVKQLDGSLTTIDKIRNHIRKSHDLIHAAEEEINNQHKDKHNQDLPQPDVDATLAEGR